MVLVEEVDLFELNESDREKLTAMLTDVPEYCCLLLTYTDFKPDKRKKKLWDALEKNAVLVEFNYQSESDLRAWIQRHFRAAGKQIAPELCGYLLQQCGLSMTRLDGEYTEEKAQYLKDEMQSMKSNAENLYPAALPIRSDSPV